MCAGILQAIYWSSNHSEMHSGPEAVRSRQWPPSAADTACGAQGRFGNEPQEAHLTAEGRWEKTSRYRLTVLRCSAPVPIKSEKSCRALTSQQVVVVWASAASQQAAQRLTDWP